MDEVLEFIKRRFPSNCHWLDGNCYYFAMILKARFPRGVLYYDLMEGHFIFKYKKVFYDWTGIYEIPEENKRTVIKWKDFAKYDSLVKERIIRDCIK